MRKIIRIFQFTALPPAADFGLLVLRLALGGVMIYAHGWGKLTGWSRMAGNWADPFGIGSQASFALTAFAEFFCALFIAIGFVTRFASLVLAINMGVAFAVAHDMALKGQGSGELAFLYLAACAALFFAGPGRFSIDRRMGAG